jgi:hypothetical protein
MGQNHDDADGSAVAQWTYHACPDSDRHDYDSVRTGRDRAGFARTPAGPATGPGPTADAGPTEDAGPAAVASTGALGRAPERAAAIELIGIVVASRGGAVAILGVIVLGPGVIVFERVLLIVEGCRGVVPVIVVLEGLGGTVPVIIPGAGVVDAAGNRIGTRRGVACASRRRATERHPPRARAGFGRLEQQCCAIGGSNAARGEPSERPRRDQPSVGGLARRAARRVTNSPVRREPERHPSGAERRFDRRAAAIVAVLAVQRRHAHRHPPKSG